MIAGMKSTLKMGVSAALLTVTMGGLAWAVEPEAFSSRLAESFKTNSWNMTSSGAESDGNDIIVRNIAVSPIVPEDPKLSQPVALGDLRFKNVSEDKEGNFISEQMNIDDLKIDNEGLKLQIKDMQWSDIRLVSPQNTNKIFKYVPYGKVSIGSASFAAEGAPFLTFNDLKAEYPIASDNETVNMAFSLNDFNFNPGETGDPKAVEKLKTLGYDKLEGSFNGQMVWNIKTGSMNSEEFKFNVKDAGTLNLTFNLDGMTADLLDDVTKLRDDALAKKIDQNVSMMGLFGLMQQISIGKLTIRYDDDSFAGRALDAGSKQNGMTRDQLVAQIKAMLPMVGVKINHPAFVKQLSDQLGNFLDNPKNLTISATPEKPVPFAILAATGASAPEKLIDLLKVQVLANQ